MESNKFDALARRAVGEDSSRRGVLRAGVSALAAAAMAVVGLRAADDAAADNKNNNDKDNHRKDKQFKRQHRKVAICYFGETLEVKKRGFGNRFPGATLGACTCQAPFVNTCGTGCCPAEFPQCCSSGRAGGERGQNAGDVCAPNTSRCCPVSQGGGACDNPTPQCCPPTNQDPFGSCAAVDAACCGNNTGGGSCPAPFTQCCPPQTPAQRSQFGATGGCCRPDQRCCNAPGTVGQAAVTAGCLAGQVCSANGCCVAPGSTDPGAGRVGGSPNGGDPRIESGGNDGGAARSRNAAKVGIAPV